jgi:carbon starvation protein CstA
VSDFDFAKGILDCFQEHHPADFVAFSYSFFLLFVSVFARSSHDTNERKKRVENQEIRCQSVWKQSMIPDLKECIFQTGHC